jgi:hypothetical protein
MGDAQHDAAWIEASGNRDRPVYYWPTSGTTGDRRSLSTTRVVRRQMMLTRARHRHGIRPVSGERRCRPLAHSNQSGPEYLLKTVGRTAVLVSPPESAVYAIEAA